LTLFLIRPVSTEDDDLSLHDALPIFGGGFAGAQWDFDQGNLAASLGHDLQYLDASLAARYQYGTTTQFGIPDIAGNPARVIHIPFNQSAYTDEVGRVFKRRGLRDNHG